MSLGKAMIHARKPKASAQGRALPREPADPHERWPGQRVSSAYTMQKPVLVLNASYEPINICGARRALFWFSKVWPRLRKSRAPSCMLHCCAFPCLRSFVCLNIAASRIRHVPSRARTSCSATAIVANTAASFCLQENSPWTTCCPVPAEASPPGRIWSPAATPAIAERAIIYSASFTTSSSCASRALLLAHQPPHHAHDRPLRPQMAQVPLLLAPVCLLVP